MNLTIKIKLYVIIHPLFIYLNLLTINVILKNISEIQLQYNYEIMDSLPSIALSSPKFTKITASTSEINQINSEINDNVSISGNIISKAQPMINVDKDINVTEEGEYSKSEQMDTDVKEEINDILKSGNGPDTADYLDSDSSDDSDCSDNSDDLHDFVNINPICANIRHLKQV